MKRLTEQVICILIVVLLIVCIVGCSNNSKRKEVNQSTSKDGGTKVTNNGPTQTNNNGGDKEPEIYPLMKFDPPITITTALGIDETSENMKYVDGENSENNVMYDMFYDIVGVKVQNKILAAPNARDEKMQLAIASNDIPDFAAVNQVMLSQLIKADMVEDMTEYYNIYASANLKTGLEQSDKALFAPAMKGDKIMALPATTTIYDFTPVLWINKTWRENLGYDKPKTMEEVFDLAMAFATKDPDGDNVNNTYGIAMNKDLQGINFFMNGYGVYTPRFSNGSTSYMMWFKHNNGNYVNGVTDPKSVKVLEKLNELYKAGAIDPEFAIKDGNKSDELIAAGKVGMYAGFFHSRIAAWNQKKNFPEVEWETISFPPAEGVSEYKPGVPLNVGRGYYYVRKGYEHPEALVVMMNHVSDGIGAPWLVEGEPTEMDKAYTAAANNPKYQGKSLNNWMPVYMAGNINWGPIFKEAMDSGKTEVKGKQADYDRCTKLGTEEDRWPWRMIYLDAYFSAEYDNVQYSDYNGAPTQTWVETKALLDQEHIKAYVAFIMGERPLDEFDNFVKKYSDLGSAKIAEEIKAAESGK